MAAATFDLDSQSEVGVRFLGHYFFQALWVYLSGFCEAETWKEGRTFEARGVISMVISFPLSSFLGLKMALVVWCTAEHEKACLR
jgi:hypothetical protein